MALYENTIRLKGFAGKDAESKSAVGGNPFIVFSLATKSSFKDKKTDEWVSHTEWHRVACFGPTVKYAQDVKKGDYIEVEGELRSSEFDAGENQMPSKRRSWEVRASRVRKLERPSPAAAAAEPDAA
jgi:single-strand DNA-binding protein